MHEQMKIDNDSQKLTVNSPDQGILNLILAW